MNIKWDGTCRACKRGRKSKFNQAKLKNKKGGARRQVKQQLTKGQYDRVVPAISIGFVG